MSPGRHDVRWRAAGLTVVAVAVIGTALSLIFRDETPAVPAKVPLLDQPGEAEVHLLFQRGVVMLHSKQYEHALTVFHNVLERRPRMPEAHVNMGFALLGMKKYAAARDFFNSAIDLHPAQANAYYGLGEALDAMGDRDGAIGAMRAFVHLAPPNDKFRVRAEAAIWELTEARDAAKTMKKGK